MVGRFLASPTVVLLYLLSCLRVRVCEPRRNSSMSPGDGSVCVGTRCGGVFLGRVEARSDLIYAREMRRMSNRRTVDSWYTQPKCGRTNSIES